MTRKNRTSTGFGPGVMLFILWAIVYVIPVDLAVSLGLPSAAIIGLKVVPFTLPILYIFYKTADTGIELGNFGRFLMVASFAIITGLTLGVLADTPQEQIVYNYGILLLASVLVYLITFNSTKDYR